MCRKEYTKIMKMKLYVPWIFYLLNFTWPGHLDIH